MKKKEGECPIHRHERERECKKVRDRKTKRERTDTKRDTDRECVRMIKTEYRRDRQTVGE